MFGINRILLMSKSDLKAVQVMFLNCWNCKVNLSELKNNLFCSECNVLQQIEKNVNYFDLLQINNQNYDIDKRKLTENYHNLQRLLHPDRFSQKSSMEQQISEQSSTIVNEAFNTLKSDSKRAWYLLQILDESKSSESLPDSTSNENIEFLTEILEWNERVDLLEEQKDIEKCQSLIQNKIRQLYSQINDCFRNKQQNDVKYFLIELNYWENLLNRINKYEM